MVVVPVPNWVPRVPIQTTSLVGRFVRVDPINMATDVPLLWEALGGIDGTINERLQWWGLPALTTPSDLGTMLEESIERHEGWGVNVFRLLDDDDKVAGMASYIATDANHGTTEVGYVAHGAAMARTAAATEAHYLLAQHALEGCGYRRLEWKCDSNNEPSGKAALRYGYSYEGCFRQHRVTARGTNRDTNWYSMLDTEWPDRKRTFEAWLDPSNFDEKGIQKRKLEDFR